MALLTLYFGFIKKSEPWNFNQKHGLQIDDQADRKDFVPRKLTEAEVLNLQKIFRQAEGQSEDQKNSKADALTPVEQASVRQLVDYFLMAYDPNASAKGFQDSITQLGLRPTVSGNQNEHTGMLKIIRTENSLPGTRYLHAQFMGDDEESLQLQNISFEIRASANTETQLRSVIQQAYEGIGEPHESEEGYAEWRLKDCRILWFKKMTAEDLQDDAFNAHKIPEDIGTYVITQEDDIHCHEVEEPQE